MRTNTGVVVKLRDVLARLLGRGQFRTTYLSLYGMRLHGFVPTTCTFNALLERGARRRRIGEVITIFKLMERWSVVGNGRTYSALVRVFVTHGRLDEAELMVLEATRRGVPPDSHAFQVLSEAYLERRDLAGMLRLLKLMQKARVELNPILQLRTLRILQFECDDQRPAQKGDE